MLIGSALVFVGPYKPIVLPSFIQSVKKKNFFFFRKTLPYLGGWLVNKTALLRGASQVPQLTA